MKKYIFLLTITICIQGCKQTELEYKKPNEINLTSNSTPNPTPAPTPAPTTVPMPEPTPVPIATPVAEVPSNVESSMLADYDSDWYLDNDGHIKNNESGLWLKINTNHAAQSAVIDNSVGIKGSSARVDVHGYGNDGLFKVNFGYDPNRYNTLQAAKGHNRMKLHVTIPYAGNNQNHTFHIGAYTKNTYTSTMGAHYYHHYSLRGSKGNHWTKMYIDERPTHLVGEGSYVVPTNPTSTKGFDYISGLSRLYLQMRYSPFEAKTGANFEPYSMYLDEIEFYTETRSENTYNINNVAVTYQGAGEFDLDWYLQQKNETNDDNSVFEVRYSYSPINTQEDYNKATLPNGMPAGGIAQLKLKTNYGHRRSTIVVPDFNQNNKIYFAIKDMTAGKPKELKRVDYKVHNY